MGKLLEKCFIIADPKSDTWGYTEDIYNKLNNRVSGVFELNEIELEKFRNLEIKPRIANNVRNSSCFVIFDSNQDPQYWLTQVAFVNHALKNSSAGEIINVFPNFFYSRQDRKDKSRVPISAKVVADIISLYANRVLTIDIHNLQIQGFYDIPFDSLPSSKTVVEYLEKNYSEIIEDKNLTIASPDVGGGKRAEAFASRIGNPNVAIGYKVKSNSGDAEQIRFAEEQVSGRNILLVDDIIDSGGTIVKACEGLKKKGANKIYAYGTHGFFTDGYNKVLGNLEKMFIGNTVKQPYLKEFQIPDNLNSKLEEISFSQILSDAIFNISTGESLTALFD